MNNREEKINAWVSALTPEQVRVLLIELLDLACDSEYVRFGDLAPYWEATGDPLIEGQQTWGDE